MMTAKLYAPGARRSGKWNMSTMAITPFNRQLSLLYKTFSFDHVPRLGPDADADEHQQQAPSASSITEKRSGRLPELVIGAATSRS